jgi:hypothetical protein
VMKAVVSSVLGGVREAVGAPAQKKNRV